MEGILCIGLIFVFIFIVILGIADDNNESNKRARKRDEFEELVANECENQNYFLAANNIIPDIDYGFLSYSDNIRARYVVDSKYRMIYIAYNNEEFFRIPFSDIVGFYILSDNRSESYTTSTTNGGVGRAFAGYLLAGGVGAIVGATTAKKSETTTTITTIGNYQIVFYLTYMNNPSFTLTLVNHYVYQSHPDYLNAVDFASKVNASIRSIIETSNRLRQLSYAMVSNSQMFSGNPGHFIPGIGTPYNQQYPYQNKNSVLYPNNQGQYQQFSQNPGANQYQ